MSCVPWGCSGLWNLKSKTKAFEAHYPLFFPSHHFVPVFNNSCHHKSWTLPLFFFGVFFCNISEEELRCRNTLVNILKYYLVTPVISTGHLFCSSCLNSTLNAFLESRPFGTELPHPTLPQTIHMPFHPWWSCALTSELFIVPDTQMFKKSFYPFENYGNYRFWNFHPVPLRNMNTNISGWNGKNLLYQWFALYTLRVLKSQNLG